MKCLQIGYGWYFFLQYFGRQAIAPEKPPESLLVEQQRKQGRGGAFTKIPHMAQVSVLHPSHRNELSKIPSNLVTCENTHFFRLLCAEQLVKTPP